jgi:hypothetical protein
MRPAMILLIHPIELPLLVIAPAIAPMMAPTINAQRKCINIPP